MGNKPFVWDDTLVQEYAKISAFQSIEDFKKQFTTIEWEIITVKGADGNLIHRKDYTHVECWLQITASLTIYSVKRLSDNSIWKIGDKFKTEGGPFTIKSFRILNKYHIEIGCECGHFALLFYIKKVKEPILKTESGEPIFEGDTFWYVHTAFSQRGPWFAYKNSHAESWNHGESTKLFSTQKAAEEWITWNRPCLSLREVVDVCNIHPPMWKSLEQFVKSKM